MRGIKASEGQPKDSKPSFREDLFLILPPWGTDPRARPLIAL